MNILYQYTTHMIRRFLTCNYFREIFKFVDFMNALMIFAKYIIVHKMAKLNYFAKVILYSKSSDQMLQSYIPLRILNAFKMHLERTFKWH